MPAGAVSVKGLAELNQAFAKMTGDLETKMLGELVKAAEPVGARAAYLALHEIRNMDQHWARMKVKATPKLVYVAPYSRRRGGSPRPNVGTLLMDRAMQPALDQEAPTVVVLLEAMLGRISDENGF